MAIGAAAAFFTSMPLMTAGVVATSRPVAFIAAGAAEPADSHTLLGSYPADLHNLVGSCPSRLPEPLQPANDAATFLACMATLAFLAFITASADATGGRGRCHHGLLLQPWRHGWGRCTTMAILARKGSQCVPRLCASAAALGDLPERMAPTCSRQYRRSCTRSHGPAPSTNGSFHFCLGP